MNPNTQNLTLKQEQRFECGDGPSSSSSSSSQDSSEGEDSLHSSSGDECEDDDERDWIEDDGDVSDNELSLCLFCSEKKELSSIMPHMLEAHGFSLNMVLKKYKMDQLAFIKMVNWVRRIPMMDFEDKTFVDKKEFTMRGFGHVFDALFESSIVEKEKEKESNIPSHPAAPWEDDMWLEPVVMNDMLLTFCCESEEFGLCELNLQNGDNVQGSDNSNMEGDIGIAEQRQYIGDHTTDELVESIAGFNLIRRNPAVRDDLGLLQSIDNLENNLINLEKNNRKMKEVVGRIFEVNSKPSSQKSLNCITDDKSVVKEEEYFESYDGLDIHAEMLKDFPRTLAYQRAIQNNGNTFSGKTVMDLGCGTGILSMFCADAGAKCVYAVDVSKMIYDAMDICYENNREGKIKFLCRKLESISEDEIEKVDVLISEFMGYFLLFEGMTNSYLYARDKFLKPGGQMYPNSADMYIVALSDEENYKNNVEIWNNIHGYKMSALKQKVLKEAYVSSVENSAIASEEVTIKKLDLHKCQVADLSIDDTFEFIITRKCSLTSICGYFSVGFQDGEQYQEVLTTSPDAPSTHWKQVVFYLPEKIEVSKGEKVPITFSCKPHPDFERWLKIDFKIGKLSCTFEMK